jgi:hypothetical protein
MTSCTELMQRILPAAHDTSGRTPLREGHVAEGRIDLEPGVVDEDVDGSELLAHRVEHRPDFGLARNVGLDGKGMGAVGFDLRNDVFCFVRAADVVHADVGTGRAERDRNRTPDTGAGACDKSGLALE